MCAHVCRARLRYQGEVRLLAFYTPYWVVNRTGHALGFVRPDDLHAEHKTRVPSDVASMLLRKSSNGACVCDKPNVYRITLAFHMCLVRTQHVHPCMRAHAWSCVGMRVHALVGRAIAPSVRL